MVASSLARSFIFSAQLVAGIISFLIKKNRQLFITAAALAQPADSFTAPSTRHIISLGLLDARREPRRVQVPCGVQAGRADASFHSDMLASEITKTSALFVPEPVSCRGSTNGVMGRSSWARHVVFWENGVGRLKK